MNILQAGPKSIHLENFCKGMLAYFPNFYFLGEEPVSYPGIRKSLITSFRKANPFSWISGYFRIHSFLKENQIELIHVHQANRLAWIVCLAARRLKIPVLCTAWGSDVLLIPQKNLFFRAITRSILRISSIITADSKEMIEAMKTINPGGKYVQLQYGIDPVESGVKEKLIYSNRLHKPLYRIDLIVQEFAAFSKKHQEWRLCIAAEGEETPKLRALVSELGIENQVEFAGWLNQQENNRFYARAGIYVSLPKSDGTSVSLLEAMAAGCIPVVSDLASNREWIEDAVNGIIYKPGSNPFETALKIDQAKAREKNAEWIKKHALRSNTSRQFFNLYQKLRDENRN